MKLIPVRKLIEGQRIMFCEDSIVRGTQLKDNVQVLFRLRGQSGSYAAGLPYVDLSMRVFEFFHIAVHFGSCRQKDHSGSGRPG